MYRIHDVSLPNIEENNYIMRDMPAPKGDPCYIKNKDRYFMSIAAAIARGSTHPHSSWWMCILTRDREVIGDGRSVLCSV